MSVNGIASAFFETNLDGDLSDLLFSRSKNLGTTAKHCTPVSVMEGNRNYKGALDRVTAIAGNPGTPPEILAKYAKDTRVSVRRELIANPSTPYPVLWDLALWAVERGDDEMAKAVDRIDLADLARMSRVLYERGKNVRFERLDLDAERIVERVKLEPEQALALARLENRALTVQLALAAHVGELEGVSLREIVDADPRSTEAILVEVIHRGVRLTVELADIWTTWTAERNSRRDHSGRNLDLLGYRSELCASVEEGAADLLVNQGNTTAQFRVGMMHGASEEVLRERLSKGQPSIIREALDTLDLRSLDARTEKVLAESLLGMSTDGRMSSLVQRLVTRLRNRLDDETMLRLLRHGSGVTTLWWLSEENQANRPAPGAIRRLWRKPGNALKDQYGSKAPTTSGSLWWGLLDAVANDPRLLGDLLELFDENLGSQLHHRRVARAVYPAVAAAFDGDTKVANWEMFLTLGGEWTDSLTALLETCRALTAGDAPTETSSTGDAETAAGEDNPLQLTLI